MKTTSTYGQVRCRKRQILCYNIILCVETVPSFKRTLTRYMPCGKCPVEMRFERDVAILCPSVELICMDVTGVPIHSRIPSLTFRQIFLWRVFSIWVSTASAIRNAGERICVWVLPAWSESSILMSNHPLYLSLRHSRVSRGRNDQNPA